ncbi:MAG: aminoglycoside phosphotransferase family protein [Saprospiraceae bacterium]|nr:aminoglycoside phosphotransferase family protein [Saprospiraceae bacterium]
MTHIARLIFYFDRLLSATPFGSGNINDTYRLDFEIAGTQKTALLQRLNHLVFRQPELVMENTLRVCEHLSKQAYPYQIAMPLPALNGAFLQKDEVGNYWRAFSFIENSFAPEGTSDPQIAFEAARAYGAFARALRDFPAHTLAETIPGFHDTDCRWEVFLKILEEDPVRRAVKTKSEIALMFSAKPVFDKISSLKKSGQLPLRVAHNDTKAGNILFDLITRKALAVIDLDTVMPGTLLSDFGDMVRTFAPDCAEDSTQNPTLRAEVLDALTRGFLEETEDFLTYTERGNLMLGAAWMAGEQALRFLTDWLAGDVYYKITSAEHNLLRARNQLSLFGTMNDEL